MQPQPPSTVTAHPYPGQARPSPVPQHQGAGQQVQHGAAHPHGEGVQEDAAPQNGQAPEKPTPTVDKPDYALSPSPSNKRLPNQSSKELTTPMDKVQEMLPPRIVKPAIMLPNNPHKEEQQPEQPSIQQPDLANTLQFHTKKWSVVRYVSPPILRLKFQNLTPNTTPGMQPTTERPVTTPQRSRPRNLPPITPQQIFFLKQQANIRS